MIKDKEIIQLMRSVRTLREWNNKKITELIQEVNLIDSRLIRITSEIEKLSEETKPLKEFENILLENIKAAQSKETKERLKK